MKNDFFDNEYNLMPREEFLQMEEELLEAERKDFIISLLTKHHFDFRALLVSLSMIILFAIVLSALSVEKNCNNNKFRSIFFIPDLQSIMLFEKCSMLFLSYRIYSC
jgi:hypothetical protein